MTEDELRKEFERLANPNNANGLKRSRRGHYVNPALARDWKFFLAGAAAERAATFADVYATARSQES